MPDICGDDRFTLIEKCKKRLIESTNIETSPEEMKVLDTILFRFWQMGWLEKLEQPSAQPERTGHWIGADSQCGIACSRCLTPVDDFCGSIDYIDLYYKPSFCPHCGAKMEGE